MTDLVARLRARATYERGDEKNKFTPDLLDEAADALEAGRKELDFLADGVIAWSRPNADNLEARYTALARALKSKPGEQ